VDRLDWMATEGGPLLVLPELLLPAWTGCEGGDYGRACAVEDRLGVIPVGAGKALVLGDEPAQTAWRPPVLVRWIYAGSEETVLRHLGRLPEALFEGGGPLFEVPGPLVLFDASWPGRDVQGGVTRIVLEPGRYRISTGESRADAETFLVLHRFEKTGGRA
jgi:hypothetical protein